MKNILLVLVSLLVLSSCKNTSEKEEKTQEENTETAKKEKKNNNIKGDFIYFDDAAVLKGSNFIYGVKLNDKAKELADKVAPYKNEDYDMIPVIVKGKVAPKAEGEEGWDEVLTITEIIHFSKKPAEADVKIQ